MQHPSDAIHETASRARSPREHRLLAAEARLLTFAPLASTALRAPELLSQGRFEALAFEALAAIALALTLALAFRISGAIIGE